MPQSSNVLSFVPMPNPEPGLRKGSTPTARPEFPGIEDEAALRKIAEAALGATNADGAALALRRDGAVVCVARAGEMAPPLGARLDDTSGMSGACLREGKAQRCDDTETDERVDAEACRELGLRSLAVAPVHQGENVIGILEVFSPNPSTFTERHVEVLRQLAELVVMDADAGAEVESPPVAKSPPEASATAVLPQPRLLPPKAQEEAQVGRTVETTSVSAPTTSSATAVASAAAVTEKAGQTQVAGTPLPGDVNISAYMAAHEKAQLQSRPRVPTFVLVGLAGLLLASFVGWYFRNWIPGGSKASLPAPQVTASNLVPAPVPDATLSAATSETGSRPDAATEKSAADSKAAHDAVTKAAGRERIANNSSQTVTHPLHVVSAPAASDAETEIAPGLAAVIGEAKPGDAKPSDAVTGLLSTPVALPKKAPPVSQGVEGGELETQVGAIYPPQARAAGAHGTVVLEALIGEDGSVRDVKVISGPPLLRQAAADAVRRWKYRPFRLNGTRIAAQTQVKVDFKLQ